MKNKYQELKARHQKEVNEFPLGAAFSQEQFDRMMEKFGLRSTDTDKIVSIGCGAFIRKSDQEKFRSMFAKHNEEIQRAIDEDKDGTGFIYDMFFYELNNHEFGYTMEADDTLESLGYAWADIENNPKLLLGFTKAKKAIIAAL